MIKKKVFFVLSSFNAGGSERVFWLLSQNFNQSFYDVSVVLLSGRNSFFSLDLKGVNVIDLQSVRASRSFFKLFNLLKFEKPTAVFTTGGQINSLVGFIYLMIKKPILIGRPTNEDNSNFLTLKAKILGLISGTLYNQFDRIICQSEEVRMYVKNKFKISDHKLIIIPNPVALNSLDHCIKNTGHCKRLIVVARLTPQKGIIRLLDIMKVLPTDYNLTIVGEGSQRAEIEKIIVESNLTNRITLLGLIGNVLEVVSQHDLFVLPSYIEGFPNVVIESLSVGTPVVSFSVSGISDILSDSFNGFIVEQNDLIEFKAKIISACERQWDRDAIREDVYSRYSIERITRLYEKLISG